MSLFARFQDVIPAPPLTGTEQLLIITPGSAVEQQATISQVGAFIGGAPVNSPAFTGTPTAPNPSTNNNSTQLATTAYVQAQGFLTPGNAVSSFNSRTGAIVPTAGDYTVTLVTGAAPISNPSFTGNVQTSVSTGVLAAGNSQGTASALNNDLDEVSGADGTVGVVLPTAVAGMGVTIPNISAAHQLRIYPKSGAKINALATNAAYFLPPGKTAVFRAVSSTQWYGTWGPGKRSSYDVFDFGAIGDGSTSDSVAINATVTAAFNAGGAEVWIPGGYVYAIDQSIVPQTGVVIRLGEGGRLKWIGSAGGHFFANSINTPLQSSGVIGPATRNFLLDCNGIASTICFDLSSVTNSEFGNFQVTGHPVGDGNSVIFRVRGNTLGGNTFAYPGGGYVGQECYDVNIHDVTSFTNPGYGLWLEGYGLYGLLTGFEVRRMRMTCINQGILLVSHMDNMKFWEITIAVQAGGSCVTLNSESSDQVSDLEINGSNVGSGYLHAPFVFFRGGGSGILAVGSGAAAYAPIYTSGGQSGQVAGATYLSAKGSGYTSAPTVVFEGDAKPGSNTATNPSQANPTTAATVVATGGGSTGGTLQAGTYRVAYTWVNNSGETTIGTSESTTFTISSGNIPQVTIPSLPANAKSANIYLTQAGGASGTETLYLTGVTTTTVSLPTQHIVGSGCQATSQLGNITSPSVYQTSFYYLSVGGLTSSVNGIVMNGCTNTRVFGYEVDSAMSGNEVVNNNGLDYEVHWLRTPSGVGTPTWIYGAGSYLATSDGSVAAAGSNQGSAALIPYDNNVVSGASGTNGVVFDTPPPDGVSMRKTVTNNAGNTLLIYPNSGAKINGLSTNASYSLTANSTAIFWSQGPTQWWGGKLS